MIRGLIIDVDGVVVGSRHGHNSPEPAPHVQQALKELRQKGVIVSVCTGKPFFAAETWIKSNNLDNPHILDAGAIVMDPLHDRIEKKHVIDPALCKELVDFFRNDVYIEVYNPREYSILKKQENKLTDRHGKANGNRARVVDSFDFTDVTKIVLAAKDEDDRDRIDLMFEPFRDRLNIQWGVHPSIMPHQFGVVTLKGVSKGAAAQELSKALDIPLSDFLGVGDSDSDWDFIQHCGHKATLANGTDNLKKKVDFTAPHVDEDGIIEILNHFGLSS